MQPPADARVTPPRIDAALDAMVSRLGRALDAVGDEQAARFLRSLAPIRPPRRPTAGFSACRKAILSPSTGWSRRWASERPNGTC